VTSDFVSVFSSYAKKPTEEQMAWSCKVTAAQEKMLRAYELDALTYY